MPKSNKARRTALQREKARRLEREMNSTDALLPAEETPVSEVKETQAWGNSRTSKWRDKNGKTKRARAVQMQPSVLAFFSVSNGVRVRVEIVTMKLTQTCWSMTMSSRSVRVEELRLNARVKVGEMIQSPKRLQPCRSMHLQTSLPAVIPGVQRWTQPCQQHGTHNKHTRAASQQVIW